MSLRLLNTRPEDTRSQDEEDIKSYNINTESVFPGVRLLKKTDIPYKPAPTYTIENKLTAGDLFKAANLGFKLAFPTYGVVSTAKQVLVSNALGEQPPNMEQLATGNRSITEIPGVNEAAAGIGKPASVIAGRLLYGIPENVSKPFVEKIPNELFGNIADIATDIASLNVASLLKKSLHPTELFNTAWQRTIEHPTFQSAINEAKVRGVPDIMIAKYIDGIKQKAAKVFSDKNYLSQLGQAWGNRRGFAFTGGTPKPGIDPTKNNIVTPIIEKGGGKFRYISDIKNSIYTGDQTVYFDDLSGSTKTLPLSKLTSEAVKEKVGIPTPVSEIKAPPTQDLKGEQGKITVYRAGKPFDKTKVTDFGISVSENPDTANIFGGAKRGLEKLVLSADAKIGEVPKTIPVDEKFDEAIAKYAKENGFDALRHTNFGLDEIRVFNPSKLQSVAPTAKGGEIKAYHGTDASFDKFDIKRAGSKNDLGFFGKGIYFSEDAMEAKAYGKNVIESNLDLSKPFDLRTKSDYLISQQMEMVEKIATVNDLAAKEIDSDDGKLTLKEVASIIKNVKNNAKISEHANGGFVAEYKSEKGFELQKQAETKEDALYLLAGDVLKYKGIKLPDPSVMPRHLFGSEDFSKILQDNGFDSVRAENEIVVFSPDPIKLSPKEGGVEKPAQIKIRRSLTPKTLTGEILRRGGLDPIKLAKDYDLDIDIKQNGLSHILRKGGQGLDDIASQFVSEGLLQVPADRNPSDYLMEQLKSREDRKMHITPSDSFIDKEYKQYMKDKSAELGKDEQLPDFDPDKLEQDAVNALVEKMNMRLKAVGKASIISPSEIKGIIREETGQVKEPELRLLRDQLKMEARAAKEGYRAGKQREPSFGADWTPEQRKDIYIDALRSGLIYKDTNNIIHNNLRRFINRYPDNSYQQIKDYIQLLGGNMKNPPKIPVTKALTISEWNQPFNDLTMYQGMPLSGLDPVRASELVDGKAYGPVRKFIVEPARDAERKYKLELKRTLEELDKISSNIRAKSKESELIFKYIENRLTPEDIKDMTPQITNTADYMRRIYDNLLGRINEVRTGIGKLPIPKRQNYVTHLQELNLLDDFFQGLSNVPDDAIKNIPAFIKPNTPFFKFALQRLGGPFKEDAIDAFRVYVSKAYPIIHNTEVIRQARALAQRLPNNAYKYFTQYIDEVLAMRPVQIDKIIPKPILSGLSWLRNRMGKGAILGNIASVLNQPFTLPNITSAVGVKFTSKAMIKIFDPAWREFVEANSKVLQGRIFEIDFDPTLLKKADNALGFLMQVADREMVRVAFGAGFEQAIAKGSTIEEAIRFADDMAFKTQSGFNMSELPPAFRSKFATTFLQFQNTVNGGFNYIKFNLGKNPSGEQTKWGTFKAALTLIGTFIALNKLYDALGLPTPVDKWNDLIPLVSMAEYGPPVTYSGPLAMLTLFISNDPQDKSKAWTTLKKSAFMMISGGNQLRKTWEGVEANIKGGKFNKKGKMLFPIKGTGEQARSVLFGPYGTRAGKRYIKNRYEEKPKKITTLRLI